MDAFGKPKPPHFHFHLNFHFHFHLDFHFQRNSYLFHPEISQICLENDNEGCLINLMQSNRDCTTVFSTLKTSLRNLLCLLYENASFSPEEHYFIIMSTY
jgi:hypothetical protein